MKKSTFNNLYYSVVTPENCSGHILYVHGGPGFHSGYFEQAIKEIPSFAHSSLGWIFYDQRGCGRSVSSILDITHDTNKKDLADFINHFKGSSDINLIGIMGHSYGGWLTFHTLTQHELSLPFVAVACAKDPRTARNHSFAIDMLEVRMNQPEIYDQLLDELSDFNEPLWIFQKRIKDIAKPLELRKHFMWGNPKVRQWYEDLKRRVNLKEDWTLTKQISNSIDPEESFIEIHSSKLKSGLLWINGVHDFLMGSDQYYPNQRSDQITFLKSGHYPHLEQPERFMKELIDFFKL